MKIPTAAPNGAPYFHGHAPVNGIEMNPQWQANGVVMEGQPPANGGGYIMPHHVINNPAGYAQAAGYYGPGASPPAPQPGPPQPQDFAEYMWMENEEEFDKQVMQQLEEEALMEQCIEAMLADEREAENRGLDQNMEEQVSKSTLNPLAAEFVPSFGSGASVVVASTSEVEVQPAASLLNSNSLKSVDSSISELSISQASDGPTDSSKSSTVEIPEELCNLPLDSSPVKQSTPDNVECSQINVEVTNESIEIVSKSADVDADVTKSKSDEPKEEDSAETKSDSTEEQKQNIPDEIKPAAKVEPVASNKSSKSQEQKSSTTKPKGNGTKIPNENKSKDLESKPKQVAEISSTDKLPTIEPEVVPVAAAVPATVAAPSPAPLPVFNYAAAARANLPPKQPSTTTPQATPTPAPVAKTESIPKETPPQSSQPQASAAPASTNKAQPKPGAKTVKNPRDNKEPPKAGSTFARSAPGPRKAKK